MADILEEIVDNKRIEVDAAKQKLRNSTQKAFCTWTTHQKRTNISS